MASSPTAPLRPPYGGVITLEQARQVMAAAEAEVTRRGWTVSIAIVENNGALVMYTRSDGLQYGSSETAIRKARTAALYRRPTKAFSDAVGGGNLGILAMDNIIPIEGGAPIVSEGLQIGAIGVSGMAAGEDGEIAQAGAAAIQG